MLVFSRRTAESFGVKMPDGRMVDITVIEIRGDRVRLGIVADKDIVVNRAEVWSMLNGVVDGEPENG